MLVGTLSNLMARILGTLGSTGSLFHHPASLFLDQTGKTHHNYIPKKCHLLHVHARSSILLCYIHGFRSIMHARNMLLDAHLSLAFGLASLVTRILRLLHFQFLSGKHGRTG